MDNEYNMETREVVQFGSMYGYGGRERESMGKGGSWGRNCSSEVVSVVVGLVLPNMDWWHDRLPTVLAHIFSDGSTVWFEHDISIPPLWLPSPFPAFSFPKVTLDMSHENLAINGDYGYPTNWIFFIKFREKYFKINKTNTTYICDSKMDLVKTSVRHRHKFHRDHSRIIWTLREGACINVTKQHNSRVGFTIYKILSLKVCSFLKHPV